MRDVIVERREAAAGEPLVVRLSAALVDALRPRSLAGGCATDVHRGDGQSRGRQRVDHGDARGDERAGVAHERQRRDADAAAAIPAGGCPGG
ncbi:MAG: hypothetical protein RLZZ387_3305 [Chloroflexota bacterium]